MKKILLTIPMFIIFFACRNKEPEIFTIQSEFLPSEDSVMVFTPETYNKQKKYPLVILLHGWSGNYKQWSQLGNLQQLADAYNFIIACPDGFYDSWYLNNPLKEEMQYEDFFWMDFIPNLKTNYLIDTANVFISGLSMGGHGAITLFLKNTNFFKSAGSTSGILDLTFFPDRWSIKDGIGSIKDFPEVWRNNSAIYLLDGLNNPNKKLYLDCGTEDFAYEANLNFAKKCQDLGYNFTFISIPGSHSHKHWRKMLPKHFEFFYQQTIIITD